MDLTHPEILGCFANDAKAWQWSAIHVAERRPHANRLMTVKKERSEYLIAENRILRGHLPMRLADPARVTLVEIAKRLGRKALKDVAQAAKPDTILAWYRRLIAQKLDGSRHLAQCRQGKGSSLLATAAPFLRGAITKPKLRDPNG